jgi:GMP synthase (glutamine-hydrolysing)
VGVQGDSRSYRAVLALDRFPEHSERAAELVNRIAVINRVVVQVASRVTLDQVSVLPAALSERRVAQLRRVDAIVRRATHESGFDRQIWQSPVVLVPLGTPEYPDSVVLRPIDSVDGMTAQAVVMPDELLTQLAADLLAVEGICAVLYDITNKPPGTIEWE